MKTIIKNGKVYYRHALVRADLEIAEGRIAAIKQFEEAAAAEHPKTGGLTGHPGQHGEHINGTEVSGAQVIDATGLIVSPGFLDIHTHGCAGVDVNAATAEDYEKLSRFQASQGAVGWQASILTDTREQTLWCIGEYERWKKLEHRGAKLIGIHLEGPFLNPEYKGAMPEYLLRKPDLALLKEYQEAAGGDIRYITVSPEIPGVIDFIPEIRKLGITVAIGHSGADYETACRAIAAGAAAATHTSNAMRLLHQHEPAIWGAVLEDDEVYCEMICDGRHLHPGTVRLIIKTKGLDRVVAVTDSIMAAGLPDGNYKLGVNDVVVKDGDARLADGGSRAGSTLTAGQGFRNLLTFTGRPMEEIIPILTENPARLLGLFDHIGSIEVGKDADLVLLDPSGNVVRTLVGGR